MLFLGFSDYRKYSSIHQSIFFRRPPASAPSFAAFAFRASLQGPQYPSLGFACDYYPLLRTRPSRLGPSRTTRPSSSSSGREGLCARTSPKTAVFSIFCRLVPPFLASQSALFTLTVHPRPLPIPFSCKAFQKGGLRMCTKWHGFVGGVRAGRLPRLIRSTAWPQHPQRTVQYASGVRPIVLRIIHRNSPRPLKGRPVRGDAKAAGRRRSTTGRISVGGVRRFLMDGAKSSGRPPERTVAYVRTARP